MTHMGDLLTNTEATAFMRGKLGSRAPAEATVRSFARPSFRKRLSPDHPIICLAIEPVRVPLGLSPRRYQNFWRRRDIERLCTALAA